MEVTLLVSTKAGVHKACPVEESGQLRFPGSSARVRKRHRADARRAGQPSSRAEGGTYPSHACNWLNGAERQAPERVPQKSVRLSGFGLGQRRGESRCQPRRRRGRMAGPHNAPAMTDCGANLPGASGSDRKGAHSALQMRAGCAIRLRFAPGLHPLADPTRTQPKARQPPRMRARQRPAGGSLRPSRYH